MSESGSSFAQEFSAKLAKTLVPADFTSSSCIECVDTVPVFSGHEIAVGDHIVFNRAHYDHHGIVVGKTQNNNKPIIFSIAEATNTATGFFSGIYYGRKAELCINTKQFDFRFERICVAVYKNRVFAKEQVAERAKQIVLRVVDYQYDVLNQNCEHFATFCVTGRGYSIQAAKVSFTLKFLLTSGLFGIDNETIRNKKLRDENIICKTCYDKNTTVFSVTQTTIRQTTPLEEGDIIRYKYWFLWHDAVVLQVKERNLDHILCKISHYAFCGIFPRTIIQEDIEIKFDGYFKKLEYVSSEFDVYDPSTVVRRAYERIGEQRFVFFVNDSYHFTRWCKLKYSKLEKYQASCKYSSREKATTTHAPFDFLEMNYGKENNAVSGSVLEIDEQSQATSKDSLLNKSRLNHSAPNLINMDEEDCNAINDSILREVVFSMNFGEEQDIEPYVASSRRLLEKPLF